MIATKQSTETTVVPAMSSSSDSDIVFGETNGYGKYYIDNFFISNDPNRNLYALSLINNKNL